MDKLDLFNGSLRVVGNFRYMECLSLKEKVVSDWFFFFKKLTEVV